MAEGKKTIVVYSDWDEYFLDLSDEEAGKLIKHFFNYINDRNPELNDKYLEMAFKPIKGQLKRDLEKWEQTKKKRSEAGKLGGKASGESRKQNEANEANALIVKQNEANEADNDTCNNMLDVNETVIVNDSNIEDVSDLKNPTPPPDKIDYDKLKKFFNENCGLISKVQILSDKRKKSISALLKKFSKQDFQKVIEKTKESNFLQGQNDRNWKADFDWILNQNNFIKILEGNYDNKQNNLENGTKQQFASTPKKSARFSIARAEKTVLADAERKQREMEERASRC